MHELLGQEFAHAGTQHGAAIGTAAVGRRTAALELHLPASAFKDAFHDRHRPPIAVAVARSEGALLDVFRAVDGEGVSGGPAPGVHRRRGDGGITGKQPGEGRIVGEAVVQPQFSEQGRAVGHVLGVRQRRGGDRDVMAGHHRSWAVVLTIAGGFGIRTQGRKQGVVHPLRELLEAVRGGGHWGGPAVRRCYGAGEAVGIGIRGRPGVRLG